MIDQTEIIEDWIDDNIEWLNQKWNDHVSMNDFGSGEDKLSDYWRDQIEQEFYVDMYYDVHRELGAI